MSFNIHITGASGFIGHELFNYLKKRKYKVFGYSRKKRINLINVNSYSNIRGNKKDILIHLAQFSNTKKKITKKEIMKNLNTSKNLVKKNWKHIIYISSTNIYGSSSKKKKESEKLKTDFFKKNNDSYSLIKAESEKIFLDKRSSILRLSNVYGKNMNNKSLFMDVIQQLNKKNITVKDSRPIRDYIYIDDVIKSIELFIINNNSGIYNIAYGKSYSVEKIVFKILKILNIKRKLISKNLFNKSEVYIDNSKLHKTFNWKCKISLNQGLKRILKQL